MCAWAFCMGILEFTSYLLVLSWCVSKFSSVVKYSVISVGGLPSWKTQTQQTWLHLVLLLLQETNTFGCWCQQLKKVTHIYDHMLHYSISATECITFHFNLWIGLISSICWILRRSENAEKGNVNSTCTTFTKNTTMWYSALATARQVNEAYVAAHLLLMR